MIPADQAVQRKVTAGLADGAAGRAQIDLCSRCAPLYDTYAALAGKISFLAIACSLFGFLAVMGYVLWLYREHSSYELLVLWFALLTICSIGFTWIFLRRYR